MQYINTIIEILVSSHCQKRCGNDEPYTVRIPEKRKTCICQDMINDFNINLKDFFQNIQILKSFQNYVPEELFILKFILLLRWNYHKN